MRICLQGRGGKVGRVLAPALEAAGHELVELEQAEAMVDFTAPDAAAENVRRALEAGVPCVVGTTGWEPEPLGEVARAVPDGASRFVSWCSSTISARGRWRAASAANRIISTAPTAKFGA